MFRRLYPGFAIVLALISSSFSASAQEELGFYLYGGYGAYSLSELKAHRQEILATLPVDAKVVDDFPGYFTFGAALRGRYNRIPIGVHLRTSSTGSRAYYADYSGSMKFDELIRTTSAGIEIGSPFFTRGGFAIDGLLLGWINFNNARFETSLELSGASPDKTEVKMVSNNFGIQPMLCFSKRFKVFNLSLETGYEFQTASSMQLASNKKYFLTNSEGQRVHFNGSGFRATLGIGFLIEWPEEQEKDTRDQF